MLKPSFSIFQRARAARTSCTMLALVGTRSVTQALLIGNLAVLDDAATWMKLISGESGLPFSGSSVTHWYSRRSLAVLGGVKRSSRLPRRRTATSW